MFVPSIERLIIFDIASHTLSCRAPPQKQYQKVLEVISTIMLTYTDRLSKNTYSSYVYHHISYCCRRLIVPSQYCNLQGSRPSLVAVGFM